MGAREHPEPQPVLLDGETGHETTTRVVVHDFGGSSSHLFLVLQAPYMSHRNDF